MVTEKVTFGWLLHSHIDEYLVKILPKQSTYMYITFGVFL